MPSLPVQKFNVRIETICVDVAEDLPEITLFQGIHTYSNWCAAMRGSFCPGARQYTQLTWEARCIITAENLQIPPLLLNGQSDNTDFNCPGISDIKVHFRFRKVRELRRGYPDGPTIDHLSDSELEHYPWLWSLRALLQNSELKPSAFAFFQNLLFPEWSKGCYNTEEITGVADDFFQRLEQFAYAQGILMDATADLTEDTAILVRHKPHETANAQTTGRVQGLIQERFSNNLVITLARTQGLDEPAGFLDSLPQNMRKWALKQRFRKQKD